MFYILIMSFLLGLTVGSFLNVVIYRLPLKEKLTGRSKCPNCGHKLSPIELIPVVSYLVQGKKCKNCGQKISHRYMLIELLTAVLFAGYTFVLLTYGYHSIASYEFLVNLVAGYIITASLISIAFIDLDTMEIPDRFHILLLLSGLAMILANGVPILDSLLAGVIIAVPMFILAFITLGLGLGDVKLLFASGFIFGAYNAVLGIFIGSVIAIIYALVSRIKKGKKFPFGPHLAAGMYVLLILTTGQFI